MADGQNGPQRNFQVAKPKPVSSTGREAGLSASTIKNFLKKQQAAGAEWDKQLSVDEDALTDRQESSSCSSTFDGGSTHPSSPDLLADPYNLDAALSCEVGKVRVVTCEMNVLRKSSAQQLR